MGRCINRSVGGVRFKMDRGMNGLPVGRWMMKCRIGKNKLIANG